MKKYKYKLECKIVGGESFNNSLTFDETRGYIKAFKENIEYLGYIIEYIKINDKELINGEINRCVQEWIDAGHKARKHPIH